MNKPMREGFVEDEPVEDDPIETKKIESPPVEDLFDIDTEEIPDWPMTVKLMHRPIMKGRDELHELTFREPSALDIIRCGGSPCRIEITEMSGGQVVYNPVIDDAKMMRLMANLSGLVEPQIQKMDTRDYTSCAHKLRRFFLPEQGIW